MSQERQSKPFPYKGVLVVGAILVMIGGLADMSVWMEVFGALVLVGAINLKTWKGGSEMTKNTAACLAAEKSNRRYSGGKDSDPLTLSTPDWFVYMSEVVFAATWVWAACLFLVKANGLAFSMTLMAGFLGYWVIDHDLRSRL